MKLTAKFVLTSFCFLFLFLFLFSGCASIPSQAPDLSMELGNRLFAIEQAHLTLLDRFFADKRQAVDAFIAEKWVPTFAQEFFADPVMAEAWQTIVEENDDAQRLQFILMVGPALQEEINLKRQEMITPLDQIQRRIKQTIGAEYDQARAINNSITSFLVSATKVAENRDRYLDMVGINDDRIGRLIDSTDTAVADLLAGASSTEDGLAKIEEYLERLESLKNSI